MERIVKIEITVPGVPIAQPRQRTRIAGTGARVFAQNYTPSKHPVQEFKLAIRQAVSAKTSTVWRGPVRVDWVAVFPRPAGKIWKRRPMPRLPHTAKPDRDNLDKAILDALTGVLLADDKQAYCGECSKWVASGDEQPHVRITITQVDDA
jgi:Holliday junction resolvase RusA-like endonuclease